MVCMSVMGYDMPLDIIGSDISGTFIFWVFVKSGTVLFLWDV